MLTFQISGNYTDLYQIAMSQAYYMEGKQDVRACFDYFFRKNPFQGGYVLFSGLQNVMHALESLHFSQDDIAFLADQGFDPKFLEFLKQFRFRGTIYASQEGDIIFPNRPVLRIEGKLLEVQLAETLLLNILNFESLIATKASRMRAVAGDRTLSEFGLRRAQGLGAIWASRAAIVGGFDSTSNVYAGQHYQIPIEGTMAHSFIVSHESELEAFRKFVEARPHNSVLLVDTYDTLRSGVPNAIKVAKEMEARGEQLLAIRLDSGDLAYLAKRARKMLDEAALHKVKIVASNQLDEYLIKSLLDQNAPIDVFGVGTNLVTGEPDAALDGVFKLASSDGIARLKISENLQKVTLPGIKQVYRLLDKDGNFYGADVVTLHEESKVGRMHHPFEMGKSLSLKGYDQEPLLHKVMEDGKPIIPTQSLKEIAAYAQKRLAKLPDEYKRFQYPHIYKVGISSKLLALREELRSKYKQNSEEEF